MNILRLWCIMLLISTSVAAFDESQAVAINLIKDMDPELGQLLDAAMLAEYTLVNTQPDESYTPSRKFKDAITCLLQRHKGEYPSLYERLQQDYQKEFTQVHHLFAQAQMIARPESFENLLCWYAKNYNLDKGNVIAIAEHAQGNGALSNEAKKGIRDVVNFLQNPISRHTYRCFAWGRHAVDAIELSDDRYEKLVKILELTDVVPERLTEQAQEAHEIMRWLAPGERCTDFRKQL